ncbi:MAG: HD domain-containing protein [Bdellovibrionales bacterium]|nr:HD domain-containing protein [Bdellovibrionales bacterium]
MEKLFVSNLADKQVVQTTFLAKNKVLLTDKKGNQYITLDLSDKTGSIDAKIWDNVERMNNSFESGDIVQVKGQVQVYQNKKQIIIHKLDVVHDENIEFENYVGRTETDPEDVLQELLQIVKNIESEHIRQLVQNTLNDPQIKDKLLKSPAAKSIHHVKVGGLIEHILSISRLMGHIAGQYPQLNLDLLIFGAIFHDLGKIWELEWTPKGIRYTDKGRLIGHLVMSTELVEKKASQILGFPEDLIDILKHIVLSHHGRLEFGSPKVPMLLEAYVVWMVDDLDSRVDSITQFLNQDTSGEGEWSSYHQMYARHFFKNNFKKKTND